MRAISEVLGEGGEEVPRRGRWLQNRRHVPTIADRRRGVGRPRGSRTPRRRWRFLERSRPEGRGRRQRVRLVDEV